MITIIFALLVGTSAPLFEDSPFAYSDSMADWEQISDDDDRIYDWDKKSARTAIVENIKVTLAMMRSRLKPGTKYDIELKKNPFNPFLSYSWIFALDCQNYKVALAAYAESLDGAIISQTVSHEPEFTRPFGNEETALIVQVCAK